MPYARVICLENRDLISVASVVPVPDVHRLKLAAALDRMERAGWTMVTSAAWTQGPTMQEGTTTGEEMVWHEYIFHKPREQAAAAAAASSSSKAMD